MSHRRLCLTPCVKYQWLALHSWPLQFTHHVYSYEVFALPSILASQLSQWCQQWWATSVCFKGRCLHSSSWIRYENTLNSKKLTCSLSAVSPCSYHSVYSKIQINAEGRILTEFYHKHIAVDEQTRCPVDLKTDPSICIDLHPFLSCAVTPSVVTPPHLTL